MKNRFSFRAYIKEEKVMRQVSAIEYDEETIITGFYINEKCYRNGDTSCYNFDDVELMQCTGVTDKNGKLIYEGDIVACDGDLACIVFSEACFYLADGTCIESLSELRPDELEVIGNIYENPIYGIGLVM